MFVFQLKCGNCGEVSEKWQYLRLMVRFPVVTCIRTKMRKQTCLLHARDITIRDVTTYTLDEVVF